MEDDAVLFVQPANEVAKFAAEDTLHRPPVRCHNMHLQFAGPQGRGHLKPDEAGAEHNSAPRRFCLGDDSPRIAERAQEMNLIGAADVDPGAFFANS